MAHTKLRTDQALYATISHLQNLLRESGDNESANSIDIILQSRSQVAAIHKTLTSHLKQQKRGDSDSSSRRLWFQSFRSHNDARLTERQTDRLTATTKHWALSEDKTSALLTCSMIWVSCPAIFWEGGMQGNDLIQRCYDDLERIEEIEPLKRKVILIILSERVEQARKEILKEGRKQRSSANPRRQQVHRTKTALSHSLRSIVQETWPQFSVEKQTRMKTTLARHSNYGWKWQQIQPSGLLLSLPPASTRSIERSEWKPVELEALNQFVQTLPQFRIQSQLQMAMKNLRLYYQQRSVSQNYSSATLSIPFQELDYTERASSFHPHRGNQDPAARLSIQGVFDPTSDEEQVAQRPPTSAATSSGQDERHLLNSDMYKGVPMSPVPPTMSGCSQGALEAQPGTGVSRGIPLDCQLSQTPQDSYFGSQPVPTVSGFIYDHIPPASQLQSRGDFNDTSFAMQGFSEANRVSPNTQQNNDTSMAMQWFIPDGGRLNSTQLGLHLFEPLLNDTSLAMSEFATCDYGYQGITTHPPCSTAQQ